MLGRKQAPCDAVGLLSPRPGLPAGSLDSSLLLSPQGGSSDDTELRYSTQYEERLDPFSSFSKRVRGPPLLPWPQPPFGPSTTLVPSLRPSLTLHPHTAPQCTRPPGPPAPRPMLVTWRLGPECQEHLPMATRGCVTVARLTPGAHSGGRQSSKELLVLGDSEGGEAYKPPTHPHPLKTFLWAEWATAEGTAAPFTFPGHTDVGQV